MTDKSKIAKNQNQCHFKDTKKLKFILKFVKLLQYFLIKTLSLKVYQKLKTNFIFHLLKGL